MTNELTIAVLGANGRLGSTVAREADARGHRVLSVTRRGGGTVGEPRAADAGDADALARAVTGAAVVVNALNPVYTDWAAAVLPMTRAVLSACGAVGAHHLYPGNVYGLGASMPPVIRPDTSDRPTTRKGRIRRDAEAAIREAAHAGRVRSTILRAGDFFGGANPGGSWLDLVVASKLGKGRVVHPGPADVPHAGAYLPDLAAAFVDLAEQRAALPRHAVFGFAGHAVTGDGMHAALERATGRDLSRSRFAWPLLRAAALVHPMSREVSEMRYLWAVPHRIDGTALEAVIGPGRPTPLLDALAAALRDLT